MSAEGKEEEEDDDDDKDDDEEEEDEDDVIGTCGREMDRDGSGMLVLLLLGDNNDTIDDPEDKVDGVTVVVLVEDDVLVGKIMDSEPDTEDLAGKFEDKPSDAIVVAKEEVMERDEFGSFFTALAVGDTSSSAYSGGTSTKLLIFPN